MFIRYHLFYYATGCLIVILSRLLHPLFFLFLITYLIWLYYRFDYRVLCVSILFCGMMLVPQINIQELPESVEGVITKVSEKYCYVKTEVGTIKLYHEENFHYHDKISCIIQSLDFNENTNDNAFNEKLYLYSQKIYYKAQLIQLKSIQEESSLYGYIESKLSNKQEVRDYQELFLFGNKNENIQEDYQQLSQLSLIHLFALSGMHIHILFTLLQSFFCIFLKKQISKWISYVCIGIYVFSIPMNISLYRAFFVLVLYEIFKRWINKLDVLSFLVIVSLFYNPYLIYNISFVFSYFVYFIVLITHKLKYSTLLIYFSTIPIVLSLNYQLPILSFLLASIMMPFIELFYCLCIFSFIFPILELGIEMCVYTLKGILLLISDVNTFLILSKPTLLFIVIYYIVFFIIIFRLSLHKKIIKHILILCCLIFSFSIYSQYKIYGEITMIDVGQGDCTLIRLPWNQGNILIDTGGNADYDLATKVIVPYLKSIGIQKLDYVYISHSDFDHCGALDSLREHFSVGEVIDKYEKYRRIGQLEVTMLNSDKYYSDSNDQSLVMKVDISNFSILFTGDASSIIEKELKDIYHHIDIDILKVSHHGSRTASSVELFEMIQPTIAMIGVKKNNHYHHPSDEVIERLKRKNITILRTDEDGMFHIRFYDKSRYILR